MRPTTYGSAEHLLRVWRWCEQVLTEKTSCGTAKTSRWWSFEERSRHALQHRWCDVMLMIYIGFRKGWWKTFSQSPLATLDLDLQPGEDDEPLPGEQADGPMLLGASMLQLSQGSRPMQLDLQRMGQFMIESLFRDLAKRLPVVVRLARAP